MKNKLLLLVGSIIFGYAIQANAATIPTVNNKTLAPDQNTEEYSFLIGGHLYGAHNKTPEPAESLMKNIDTLNATNAAFFISLGDIVQRIDSDWGVFQKTVGDKLNMPIFNAVGNHDVEKRDVYQKHVPGKTYFDFQYGNELFLFLDTVVDPEDISGEQLLWLINRLEDAADDDTVKNIIIATHYILWRDDIAFFGDLYANSNGPLYGERPNYIKTVRPLLKKIARKKHVYQLSGDIGTSWSRSLFFHSNKRTRKHYIATGIGDTPRDAIIKAEVKDGGISFSAISLTENPLNNIEEYDREYWSNEFYPKREVRVPGERKTGWERVKLFFVFVVSFIKSLWN